jgi:phage-related protein
MTDKPIAWVGAAKQELLNFPDDARRKAGFNHDGAKYSKYL